MWWFISGLIVGAGIMRLVAWVQSTGFGIGWYAWLILGLMVILGTLTVQHFFAAYKRQETRAAWMGVLIMGVPAVILAGISAWLFLR